jgi:hypothetical protein
VVRNAVRANGDGRVDVTRAFLFILGPDGRAAGVEPPAPASGKGA